MNVKLKKILFNFMIPIFYTVGVLLMVFFQWNNQHSVRHEGKSPIYINLANITAYAKRGMDLNFPHESTGWSKFDSPPFRIINSGIPNLPKRTIFSPFANPDEEFTIAIIFNIDSKAIEYLQTNTKEFPGLYIACIGENWEIYLNGNLIQSAIYLDENGKIKERRTWRDVHFPIDKNFFKEGDNLLTFRIIGDPSYDATGIYYFSPFYIDDYHIIDEKQKSVMLLLLCGVFGFIGFYYITIFISIREKKEIFNLYYGIFSLLLCGYAIARNGVINYMIPNSDISIRLEFATLFTLVPFIGLFIESLSRQKVTTITKTMIGFCVLISVLQIFFCAQFGQEMLVIWNVIILLYFSYIFVYHIIYYYFLIRWKKQKRDNNLQTSEISLRNILFGSVVVYFCGIYDILDVMFFHNSFQLFVYSCFVFHIGIAFTLSQRFSSLYKQMEKSNLDLEKAVHKRTLELEEQTKIAVNASEVKSKFLANMSHEIRTPMNAITGMSEMLLRGNLSDEMRCYAQDIKQAGNNLLSIINDILDISKIEAGKIEIIPVNYSISLLVNDSINIIRPRLKQKLVWLETKIEEDVPDNLIGDDIRLRQVILNLLSNAVKYTDKGNIYFFIGLENKTFDNLQLIITVKDTGIGIRSEDIPKLFDTFVQVDKERNLGVEGTGLGLAITKQLVDAMNGSINVESEYGKGSAFTVIIPQGIASGELVKDIDFSAGFRNDNSFDIKYIFPNTRILVVDDMDVNLKVAEGLLSSYKIVVDLCSSGVEAIELVKFQKFDLIFMDHMMPVMDGIEATKKIREWENNNSSIPIIALTANAVSGMKETFLENGFNDFLAKPIDIFKLDEILNRWLPDDKKEPANSVNTYSNEEKSYQSNLVIKGINTFLGIAMVGGKKNMYLQILSVFCENALERLQILKKEINKENISDFVTHIHALKGALGTIGAKDLSDMAAALEEAGKNENLNFIKENLLLFNEQLTELLENINKVLREKNE